MIQNRPTSRRRALVAMALLACAACAVAIARAPEPSPPSVRLVIDFGDGTQKVFKSLAWSQGMTVLDAMSLAKPGPRGIAFEFTGSGDRAFLKSIDGQANDAAKKIYWLYWVNGALADQSFGVKTLEASDAVQWEFAPQSAHKELMK